MVIGAERRLSYQFIIISLQAGKSVRFLGKTYLSLPDRRSPQACIITCPGKFVNIRITRALASHSSSVKPYFFQTYSHSQQPEKFQISIGVLVSPRTLTPIAHGIQLLLQRVPAPCASPPEQHLHHRMPVLRVYQVKLSRDPATISVDLPLDRRAPP